MPKISPRPDPHKTRAGVDWIGSSVAVAVKISLDLITQGFFSGYEEKELRENWSAIAKGSGFLSLSNQREMEDRVDLLVPQFREMFERDSTHIGGMGYALVHRARHTVAKDETARFRGEIWSPFYNMVEESVSEGREITPERRYQAHESVVLSQVYGSPGVYVNVAADSSNWMYMGESEDVAKRHLAHRNGGLYLARVYVTGSKAVGLALQNSLFHKIEQMGIIRDRRIPEESVGKQGGLKIEAGVNPIQILDVLVKQHYREFCRATVGII